MNILFHNIDKVKTALKLVTGLDFPLVGLVEETKRAQITKKNKYTSLHKHKNILYENF